ncbi:MAG: hypothetical protein ACK4JY_02810 [Brevundimonas sp.]|uniref:hypothetical protein n=1 Tax=Brevundimonas sp. TaxID=1871086 RepID=UPI0039195AFB
MIPEMLSSALLSLTPVQDPPPTVLDEVVVEGVRRTEQTAFRFIETVSAPPFGSRTLAVWTTPLCLSVENLPPEATEALRHRILGRAEYVGAGVAQGECAPNVVVIFTADGARTASALVEANGAAFRPTTGPTQLDPASRGGSPRPAERSAGGAPTCQSMSTPASAWWRSRAKTFR